MNPKLLIPTNKQLFSDAWERQKGAKWHFFLWFMISLVWACVIFLIASLFHLDTWSQAHVSDWGAIVIPLIAAIGSSVFFLGASSMGIARARDQGVSIKAIFTHWRKLLKVIIVLFSIMVLNLFVSNLIVHLALAVAIAAKVPHLLYGGFIIADLVIIAINALFMLSFPTAVDSQHGPFKSMYLSWTRVRPYFWQCYGLFLLLYLFTFLSIFTLFVAYVWLLPVSFIIFGRLYLQLIDTQVS